MMKVTVIKTKRLIIYPLSDNEMATMIDALDSDDDMKQAYSEMLDGCKQNPEQRIWHAVWNIQLNDGTDMVI